MISSALSKQQQVESHMSTCRPRGTRYTLPPNLIKQTTIVKSKTHGLFKLGFRYY